MHTRHIVLVQAENAEEALEYVNQFLDDSFEARWSDWSVIGGRWDGLFDGNNVLQYVENPQLFEKTIEDALETRKSELDRYLEEVGDLDIKDVVNIYAEMENGATDFDFSMKGYYALKAIQSARGDYDCDSMVYDITAGTTSLRYFRKRLLEDVSTQWAVVVDYHF